MENISPSISTAQLSSELENFPPDESFQNVPSILLKDLRRTNPKGKRLLEEIDIVVYVLLKSHSRMKGECHPSLERLAFLAARSTATIQRSLRRLDAAGHIQRKSHNKGKIFLLTDVSADGHILRRKRIAFNAKPRIVSLTPPMIQDAVQRPIGNLPITQSPIQSLASVTHSENPEIEDETLADDEPF